MRQRSPEAPEADHDGIETAWCPQGFYLSF